MIAACPSCQARYRVDTSRLKGGRGRLKCAKCGEIFPVQSETPAPEAPVAEAASAAAAVPPTGAPSVKRLLEASRGAPASKLSVAVVGCEPGPLRERLVSVLAKAGVRTLTSDDGPTCLDMARRTRPKLVLAASYLPGLTGPELAEALRAEPALVRTRIILLAAAGAVAPPPGCVDADAVLDSGDAPERVAASVHALLSDQPGERELDEDQEKQLKRQVQVAARELALYHAGRDGAARKRDVEQTREWLVARWPECPRRACYLFEAALAELGS